MDCTRLHVAGGVWLTLFVYLYRYHKNNCRRSMRRTNKNLHHRSYLYRSPHKGLEESRTRRTNIGQYWNRNKDKTDRLELQLDNKCSGGVVYTHCGCCMLNRNKHHTGFCQVKIVRVKPSKKTNSVDHWWTLHRIDIIFSMHRVFTSPYSVRVSVPHR